MEGHNENKSYIVTCTCIVHSTLVISTSSEPYQTCQDIRMST